jgi:hypothetical protein
LIGAAQQGCGTTGFFYQWSFSLAAARGTQQLHSNNSSSSSSSTMQQKRL